LYENLIDEEKGVYNDDGSLNLNPNSLVIKKGFVEPELLKLNLTIDFNL
jgi:glutaminyl-tRNA synthetase